MPGGLQAVKHLCQELHTECGLFSKSPFDAWGYWRVTKCRLVGPRKLWLAKISQQVGCQGPARGQRGRADRPRASLDRRAVFRQVQEAGIHSARVQLLQAGRGPEPRAVDSSSLLGGPVPAPGGPFSGRGVCSPTGVPWEEDTDSIALFSLF